MGFLEELQSSASDLLDAAKEKAVDQIKGQQTPLPQTVVAPLPASGSSVSSMNSSTMTMILGALAIGAIAFFAVKKVKA